MKINLKTVLVTSAMTLHGLAACAAAAGEDERPASPRTALRACEKDLYESQKDRLWRLVENEEDFYKNLKVIKALNEAEKDGTLTRSRVMDLQYMAPELALKHLEMRKGLKEAEGGAVSNYRHLDKLNAMAVADNPDFDLFHNHLNMFKALKEVAKVTTAQQFDKLNAIASGANPNFDLFHNHLKMFKALKEAAKVTTAQQFDKLNAIASGANPNFDLFHNHLKMFKALKEAATIAPRHFDTLNEIASAANPNFDLFYNHLNMFKALKAFEDVKWHLALSERCELEDMIKAANPDLNAFYEKLEKLKIK